MMRDRRFFEAVTLAAIAILVTAVMFAGCAGMGVEPPKSFEDRLAYATGTNTALRDASTSSLDAGMITSADMEHVMEINAKVKTLLLAARRVSGADLSTAESKLIEATKLLTDLQTYLRARGVKTSYLIGELTWAT
jgi:PBP1b-binding outer membrane lipoprotein LpoB